MTSYFNAPLCHSSKLKIYQVIHYKFKDVSAFIQLLYCEGLAQKIKNSNQVFYAFYTHFAYYSAPVEEYQAHSFDTQTKCPSLLALTQKAIVGFLIQFIFLKFQQSRFFESFVIFSLHMTFTIKEIKLFWAHRFLKTAIVVGMSHFTRNLKNT